MTVGRTLLNDPSVVTLEGGKSQVIVWTNENGTTRVLNQPFVPFRLSLNNGSDVKKIGHFQFDCDSHKDHPLSKCRYLRY